MADATLPEQIADRLRRDILRGTLAPGTPIKERDHALELGVSRTPLREAVRILAKEGLVMLRPARSPIVSEPSYEDIAHNIEVLAALEILSARLACTRASDGEIAAIAALAQRMEAEYDRRDMIDTFEIDMGFHRAIAEAAGNPVLADVHRALLARLWRARYLSASRKRSRDRVLAQHAAIVEALKARNAEAVAGHVRAHLDRLLVNVQDYFAKGGGGGGGGDAGPTGPDQTGTKAAAGAAPSRGTQP